MNNHLLNVPENHVVQFSGYAVNDEQTKLNVYVFDKSEFNKITEIMSGCHFKADAFVYPLLALQKDDKAVYSQDIDRRFYFCNESWIPADSDSIPDAAYWQGVIQKIISVPEQTMKTEDFIRYFLPCCLIARLVKNETLDREYNGIQCVPSNLRPSRFRIHLYCFCILIFLLSVFYGWRFSVSCVKRYREYKTVTSELKSVKNKTKTIQQNLKRAEKEQKELLRITQLSAGTQNILEPLASIS